MNAKTLLLVGLLSLLTGCSILFDDGPKTSWVDANGALHEVVFSDGAGSDLFDAYNACGKDIRCYHAYIEVNNLNYKRRSRGKIRLYARDGSSLVYAEHNMDSRTNEILAPLCFLALDLDDSGNIIDAEYKR